MSCEIKRQKTNSKIKFWLITGRVQIYVQKHKWLCVCRGDWQQWHTVFGYLGTDVLEKLSTPFLQYNEVVATTTLEEYDIPAEAET